MRLQCIAIELSGSRTHFRACHDAASFFVARHRLRESIEQMKSEAAKLQGMGQSLEEELANTKHSMAHQSATVQQLEDSISAAKSQILEQENAAAETIAEKESLVEDLRNQLAPAHQSVTLAT